MKTNRYFRKLTTAFVIAAGFLVLQASAASALVASCRDANLFS